MSTKSKSTENCCKSCVWKCFFGIFKWLFGKSSGTFLLGIGTVIAAWQLSPVLEKITEVKKVLEELQNSNNEIKQATKKINETVDLLKTEWENSNFDGKITQRVQSQDNMDKKVKAFEETLEKDWGAATKSDRPWGAYISDEKRNDLVQKFKQNPSDLARLKNEFLQSIETSSDSPTQNSK